ncbi:hypothetical protein KIN20_017066 [Parelaphostrongylus tenuis]|uniref:Transmembrane protein n=1 Tax=Parelaphostrongylus tenuis TaxID=148309 RepID=A0AAD5N2N1_PARTN|nr:hypothetical protein KIN20_017066 [Parelaphostrongylus tenuis]
MGKKVQFKSKEENVYKQQRDREFCCRISLKGAASIVVVLEALYWFYYLLILIFAIVNHRQAWSIVILSINLLIIGVQVVIAGVGVWQGNTRLLLTHLIFLVVCLIWDLFVITVFLILIIYSSTQNNGLISYNGEDFNARLFGIVMGSTMLIFLRYDLFRHG